MRAGAPPPGHPHVRAIRARAPLLSILVLLVSGGCSAGNIEARPLVGDQFVLVWAGQRAGELGSLTHTPLPGISARLAYDPRGAFLVIEPD